MRLSRRPPQRSLISLVSMIDVLMIMLVFFMVTSTYLNLDMVPMAERGEAASGGAGAVTGGGRMLIRIAADGVAHVEGQAVPADRLAATIGRRMAADPALEVIVLPSGHADVQALVAVMDAAVAAGSPRLRVVRLEARP